MARSRFSSLEPLEARIAPAGVIVHPFLDMVASVAKTNTVLDLSNLVDSDPAANFRTWVEFTTNFDISPAPGLQPGKIVIELFNDKAPATVANFLHYVENVDPNGDYDGTFFHRLASGFVLQGGGYTTNYSEITKDGPVVNEYNPNDAERSNVRGTVAMAKVGGDPNSATSEFFFNLGDNSANLNNQNGGFTVFAKVVKGMDVVDAISSLNTAYLNETYNTVPTQGGYNDQTASSVPTAKQLIQITTAKVVEGHQSSVAGYKYVIESIQDTATLGDANPAISKAVTGKIVGDKLTLNYSKVYAGDATVTVKILDKATGLEVGRDQFNISVQPDLVAGAAADSLPSFAVAGNTGKASVGIYNNGAGVAKGPVNVSFYLSQKTDLDPNGTILDANDLLVGQQLGYNINLASGKSTTISQNIAIPAGVDLENGNYTLIAKVDSSASPWTESRTDNNTVGGTGHYFFKDSATKGNISVTGVQDGLSTLLVPGDTGLGQILITNTSGQDFSGAVKAQFVLSFFDTSTGVTTVDGLDNTDLVIGSLTNPINISLAAGKSMVLSVPVAIPNSLLLENSYSVDSTTGKVTGSAYHIFGVVQPANENDTSELALFDNYAANGVHYLKNIFGSGTATFSDGQFIRQAGRTNAVLTYEVGTAEDHHIVKLQLKGPGGGAVFVNANGLQVQVDNTTLASSLTAISADATEPVVLGNVLIGFANGSPIGKVEFGNVKLGGDLIAIGGAKSINLGSTTADATHNIGIGGSQATKNLSTSITLGAVTDTNVDSLLPVSSFIAKSMRNTDATAEALKMPKLTNFKIEGDLEASVYVSATFLNSTGLANPTVPLASTTAAVANFSVGGTFRNAMIGTDGNLGTVKLGAMQNSAIFVGTHTVPIDAGGFEQQRTITKMEIGQVGGPGTAFTNSLVVASTIKSLSLGAVNGSTGDAAFGVLVDKLAKYISNNGTAKNLDAPGVVDQQGLFAVQVV